MVIAKVQAMNVVHRIHSGTKNLYEQTDFIQVLQQFCSHYCMLRRAVISLSND